MFLWVRLMFVTFRDLDSIFELRKAVDGLPNGLDEASVKCHTWRTTADSD